MQSPSQRSSNLAPVVVISLVVGVIVEVVTDLFLDFAVTFHSLTTLDAVSVVLSLVLALIVGGVMFLGRPRRYGVTALAGAVAVVSGIAGDLISLAVYFTVKHLPISSEVFTGYFTTARTVFWINNVCAFAVAAGVTALRVRQVRATADRGPAGTGAAPPPWSVRPPGPWDRHPRPPYGDTPYTPPGPYGPPPPQSPHGPPPPAPYGSPPQSPYGPPS